MMGTSVERSNGATVAQGSVQETLHSVPASGRIDESGWEGAEDTDPSIPPFTASDFDVLHGAGPLWGCDAQGFSMVCDDGCHPDRPIGVEVGGLGYDLAPALRGRS